jgi:predicted Zn-dependent protease with MMP-like domain
MPAPAATEPEGEHYSREEVEAFIATAVADAEERKQSELEKAVKEASDAIPAGYTQDQVNILIVEAEDRKEQEVLASLPDQKPQDQIDELTDEGDLKLRAEVKTLRSALTQMDTYTKELEAYIAQVEGRPAPATAPAATSSGRPLPKIRPEDL